MLSIVYVDDGVNIQRFTSLTAVTGTNYSWFCMHSMAYTLYALHAYMHDGTDRISIASAACKPSSQASVMHPIRTAQVKYVHDCILNSITSRSAYNSSSSTYSCCAAIPELLDCSATRAGTSKNGNTDLLVT
jgi:imidazole glycerol phosphate synthase subunit HisF